MYVPICLRPHLSLLSFNLGEEISLQIASAHEFGAKENLNQSPQQQALFNMDLYNNHVGRDIAKYYRTNLSFFDSLVKNHNNELANLVQNNINQGLLVIIN